MTPEGPATGESQSHGVIEEASKIVRGFAIVSKMQIEDRAKNKLEADDVILQWIIRWAAMSASRPLVGKDCATGHEIRRGRKCKLHAVPIAGKHCTKESERAKCGKSA
mgnify:CR=1 FL=1